MTMKTVVYGSLALVFLGFAIYLGLAKYTAKPRTSDASYGVVAHYRATGPSDACVRLLLKFAESRTKLKVAYRTAELNALNKQTRAYRDEFKSEGCDDRWALAVIRAQEKEL